MAREGQNRVLMGETEEEIALNSCSYGQTLSKSILNEQDWGMWSGLHWLRAGDGSWTCVVLLLPKLPATLQLPLSYGWSPLLFVCLYGWSPLLFVCLWLVTPVVCVSVWLVNPVVCLHGWSPLLFVCLYGWSPLLFVCLYGWSPLLFVCLYGWSPLLFVCLYVLRNCWVQGCTA